MTTVLVSVGTDHHPFDRLLRWAASWAAAHPDAEVVAQVGSTAPVPGIRCEPFFGVHELDDLMAQASAVVSHGGPGTITQARTAGHLPVVVPRRSSLGEHVDDHQVRFAGFMADRRAVVVADDEAALHAAIDAAVARPRRPATERGAPAEVVDRFGDLVESIVRQQKRRGRRS